MTYKGADTSGPPRPRRKRHIFAWTVLALQVVFIIWLVIGASIGAALVVIIWVAADALAGVTFVVARLARDWRNDLP
jgi:predicted secreted protein